MGFNLGFKGLMFFPYFVGGLLIGDSHRYKSMNEDCIRDSNSYKYVKKWRAPEGEHLLFGGSFSEIQKDLGRRARRMDTSVHREL